MYQEALGRIARGKKMCVVWHYVAGRLGCQEKT